MRKRAADPAIDAVVLAVPNRLHAPMIAALEAGKHVLAEKPMAATVAEAQAMIAARDASDRTLMVGMNQRYHARPGLKLIADGTFGTMQTTRAWWLQQVPQGPLGSRRMVPAQGTPEAAR